MAHPSTSFSSDGESCSLTGQFDDNVVPRFMSYTSCKMRWYAHLDALQSRNPRIFSGSVLRRICEKDAGALRLKGIGVSLSNCLGIRRIYDAYYKPRLRKQKSRSAEFEHLKITVSQFLRMAVCFSVCAKEVVWEEHTLFTCVCNQQLVDRFIDVFFERSSRCTLRTKATCLKRVCDVGVVFGKDEVVRNQLTLASVLLQNIANGARRAHRTSCQRRKLVPSRVNIPLNPSSMNFLKRRARTVLDDTMRPYLANKRKSSCRIMKPYAYSKLKVWSINFAGLVMLMSGGQRPQVFSQLQLPSRQECLRLFAERQKSYIELRTVDEKRPRHLDLPLLVLPSAVLPYLKFHVKVIRPAILELARSSQKRSYNPLILHWKTGKGLQPSQVTRALQKFFGSHSTRLENTTTMDLRRSYASMMLRAYLQNQIFPELPEAEFLQKIAQQMNTSVEQLRRTYMSPPGPSNCPETAMLVKFWSMFLNT